MTHGAQWIPQTRSKSCKNCKVSLLRSDTRNMWQYCIRITWIRGNCRMSPHNSSPFILSKQNLSRVARKRRDREKKNGKERRSKIYLTCFWRMVNFLELPNYHYGFLKLGIETDITSFKWRKFENQSTHTMLPLLPFHRKITKVRISSLNLLPAR